MASFPAAAFSVPVDSHTCTVLKEIPARSASSRCDNPAFFRLSFNMLSAFLTQYVVLFVHPAQLVVLNCRYLQKAFDSIGGGLYGRLFERQVPVNRLSLGRFPQFGRERPSCANSWSMPLSLGCGRAVHMPAWNTGRRRTAHRRPWGGSNSPSQAKRVTSCCSGRQNP